VPDCRSASWRGYAIRQNARTEEQARNDTGEPSLDLPNRVQMSRVFAQSAAESLPFGGVQPSRL